MLMLMPVAAGQMACRRAAGRMAGWLGAVQTSVLNRTLLNLRQDFIGTSLSELCFCVSQCSLFMCRSSMFSNKTLLKESISAEETGTLGGGGMTE